MPNGARGLPAKLRTAIAFGTLIGLLGALLQMSLPGAALEEAYGLGWLFAARGPIVAPSYAVIVSMDKQSAAGMGLSPAVPWPRYVHACLIEILARQGATLILFDVFFRPTAPLTGTGNLPPSYLSACPEVRAALAAGLDHDRILAQAMARFGRVMLLQRIDREFVDLENGLVIADQPKPPAPPLAEAALAVAPFTLPVERSSVVRFLDAHPLGGREIPSLPFVAARHFSHAASIPVAGAPPPAGYTAAPGTRHGHILNFYGPPGSVCTIPFVALLEGHTDRGSSGCTLPVSLVGKAVFVGAGWSRVASPNQIDEFDTAFSDGPGKHVNGVEILATAFSNLLARDSIRPLGRAAAGLTVCAMGAAFGALVIWIPGIFSVAIALAAAGLYAAAALATFRQAGLWMPLFIPIALQLPMAIVLGLLFKYLISRRAIMRYVPHRVAERVFGSGRGRDSSEELFGACLCTDVAHYTALSEQVSPIELAELTNRYFSELGTCVNRHGGEMLDIVGDGMTSVWPAPSDNRRTRLQACLAALDIVHAVSDFNRRHPTRQFPTRIGMNTGRVAMGEFGGGGHYRYSVVGDIVNTASRLEGLNKFTGTQILAAQSVVQDLGELQVRPLGRFQLKGKAEILDVVEVRARSEDASPSDQALCKRFAEGVSVYATGHWEQALALFETLLHDYPTDGPSRFYRERCLQYPLQPATLGAPGVVKLDVK